MKRLLLALLLLAGGSAVMAQDLRLAPEDLVIDQSLEGGYNLYIRAKPGIGSVLLTESTEDPNREAATYAYRNPDYHPANGDEPRVLDGEFLRDDLYSLIDSSPQPHETLGEAFRIFIPYVIEYGYPWSRNGRELVVDGTYLSVRTFEQPFADYTGSFQDNPFVLRVIQRASEPADELAAPEPESPEPADPEPPPASREYMDRAVTDFSDIARENDGETAVSSGEADTVERIADLLGEVRGGSLDLVLALDTTRSMEDDIPFLQERLVPLLAEETVRFESFRIGMVFYRDYLEEYLTRAIPFQTSLETVQQAVNGIRVAGGRDLPEAVYEALHSAIHSFDWEADDRLVILVGDAPPHPLPRGRVTRESVFADARDRDVRINTIILPSD